jgi:hypothetical protein
MRIERNKMQMYARETICPGYQDHSNTSTRMVMIPRALWRSQNRDWTEERDLTEERTDFYRNECDDDLLEAFGMSTGHGLLQELQHILQHLDAGVKQVDTLKDLKITSCCVIEWSQVRVRLGHTERSGQVVSECASQLVEPGTTYPEYVR